MPSFTSKSKISHAFLCVFALICSIAILVEAGTCDCYCCGAEDDASVTGAMNCLTTAASVSAGVDSSDVELKGSFDATFDSDCTLDECDTRYSMQCGTTNNMHVAACVGCINETSSASPLHIYASTLLASFACALTFLL
jgi:hypothetical protein